MSVYRPGADFARVIIDHRDFKLYVIGGNRDFYDRTRAAQSAVARLGVGVAVGGNPTRTGTIPLEQHGRDTGLGVSQ